MHYLLESYNSEKRYIIGGISFYISHILEKNNLVNLQYKGTRDTLKSICERIFYNWDVCENDNDYGKCWM